ncbi:MAG: hypothetical protein RL641_946 [Candidatus Parcubacteria bacterium]|jgi:hypothetical protein
MKIQDNQQENAEPKKSGMLFIVFALGFLAVLAGGYNVLTSFQVKEAAMFNSAALIRAKAGSSQGISQQLPQEEVIMAEESSIGIFNDKGISTKNSTTIKKVIR